MIDPEIAYKIVEAKIEERKREIGPAGVDEKALETFFRLYALLTHIRRLETLSDEIEWGLIDEGMDRQYWELYFQKTVF